MIQLRKRLSVASAGIWGLFLCMAVGGWGQWTTYPATFPSLQLLLAALSQMLLWAGLVVTAGALFTHILIVRDNELYEPADDASGCACGDGCCAPTDQSNISS